MHTYLFEVLSIAFHDYNYREQFLNTLSLPSQFISPTLQGSEDTCSLILK